MCYTLRKQTGGNPSGFRKMLVYGRNLHPAGSVNVVKSENRHVPGNAQTPATYRPDSAYRLKIGHGENSPKRFSRINKMTNTFFRVFYFGICF